METVHDILFSMDFLIAITFLEEHEKEVILEKVVPRIRITLASVRDSRGNPLSEKLDIEILLEGEKETSQENIVQEDVYHEEIVCKPDLEVEERALMTDYRNSVLEIESEVERDKATESHYSLVAQVYDVEDDEEEEDQDRPIELVKKDIECNICGKVITRPNFRRHMKKIHQQNRSSSDNEMINKVPDIHYEISAQAVLKMEQVAGREEYVKDESILEIRTEDHEQKTKRVVDTKMRKNNIECRICGKTIKRSCFRKHMKRMHQKIVRASDNDGKPALFIPDKNSLIKQSFPSSPSYCVVKCKLCNKDMLKKSIALHMKRAHDVLTEETVKKISDLLHSTAEEIREMKNQLNKKDDIEHDMKVEIKAENKYNRNAVEDRKAESNMVTSILRSDGSCDQCDKMYSTKKNMIRHRFSAHPELYKKYTTK